MLAHEVIIESAQPFCRVDILDSFTNVARTANVNPMPAALPKQEFDQPFDICEIRRCAWVNFREYLTLETRQISIIALQADHQRYPVLRNLLLKGPVGQDSRPETIV